jgi:hypothetical protein
MLQIQNASSTESVEQSIYISYTADISAQLIPTYQFDGSDNVRVSMRFACGVQTGVATDGVVGFNFT